MSDFVPLSVAAGEATRDTTGERSPLVVLNPASRRGRHLRGALERALAGGRGELMLTDSPGAAERLAGEAARGARHRRRRR